MLTLRLTQKLASRLQVELPATVPPGRQACADWCCHAFTFARRRHLLITHPTTFFSVVMLARGAGNASDFIRTVSAGLHTYLAHSGHAVVYEQLIAPEMMAVSFSPINNRQVLGVMNDFIQIAPHYLNDLSPFETSDRLNHCPVSPLRGGTPASSFPPGGSAVEV